MAAPPPQGDDAEAETIAFGIAAVDEALEATELSFPADADEILEATGDRDIPYDTRGRTIRLSTAIEESEGRHFDTRRELLNALHPVFEEKRDSSGLSGWVRTLLPF